MHLPHVFDREKKAYVDLATHLLEHRTLFIGPELNSAVASAVAMQLLALSAEEGEIVLYLNCYGGSLPAGLAIADFIDHACAAGHPVHTYCIGECVGVATAILAAGTPGKRKAFPSARISLYQEWYGVESLWGATTQDSGERTRLLKEVRDRLAATTHLGREEHAANLDSWLKNLSFLSVADAIEYGIVDAVVEGARQYREASRLAAAASGR